MRLTCLEANRCFTSYNRTSIGALSYTYKGVGDQVRVDKSTGTGHFVYDAWGRVVAEYGVSASDVKAEFIWALPPATNDNSPFGGGDHIAGYAPLALVAENSASQLELYWVHGNHLGVPIVTTDAQGQVVSPANDFLRLGFPGQSQVLSDLYYNRARDYDPLTGRYIQADPIGLWGDVNPYVYAGADPVNMLDPFGLRSTDGDWTYGTQFALIKEAGDALAAVNARNAGLRYCIDPIQVMGGVLLSAASMHPLGHSTRLGRSIWTATKRETPVQNAFRHWKDHRKEFPEFANAKQYVDGARRFFRSPPSGTLRKTRSSNGDQLFYHPSTNTFGVQRSDGAIRTMSRPKSGRSYWNEQ